MRTYAYITTNQLIMALAIFVWPPPNSEKRFLPVPWCLAPFFPNTWLYRCQPFGRSGGELQTMIGEGERVESAAIVEDVGGFLRRGGGVRIHLASCAN